MKFTWTDHALLALDQRDIEQAWVVETIEAPQHVEEEPRHEGRRLAFRRIAARGDRWLRVVYEAGDKEYVVITAFFDRNAGRWT